MLRKITLALSFSLFGSILAADPAKPARLDREDLLAFHRGDGAVHRAQTREDWQQRRAEILRGMQAVMGPLPGAEKRCALDVEVEEEFDAGDHLRRKITYAAEPGGRARAFLLIPKAALAGKEKFPAVLCLHGTDNVVGHRSIVEEGHKTNRTYALELAKRGYVTLAPAYPQLADYQPDLKALGYASGTMKAIWDNMRGLDLLDSLPFVQRGHYAAIGHSLGGHNSVYTAVFDERLKAVVSSCGLDSYADYKGGDITGWTSARYMPRLAQFKGRSSETPFDFDELLAALAPRPVMLSAPLHDANFAAASVDRIAAAARAVYALQGAPDSLVVEHPDGEHDFPDGARDKAYAFLNAVLRPAMRG